MPLDPLLLDPALFAARQLQFHPEPRQKEMLRLSSKRVILNCSRQCGKSTITAIIAIHRAHHFSKSLILVVTPSGRQSAEFVRKLEDFLPRLGLTLKGDGDNRISVLFPNGSRIVGLPANEDTCRGFSGVDLLIIDEASRVPDRMYDSVLPMIASGAGGSLWLLSTPNGRTGFFYDVWSGQDTQWQRISVPASECPRISKKFLAEMRRTRTTDIFNQEYGCEFLNAEASAFRDTWLESAVTTAISPLGKPDAPTANFFPRKFCDFYVGLDLGQRMDYAAISIIERTLVMFPEKDYSTYQHKWEFQYRLRYLERLPLGTTYLDIIRHVRDLCQHPAFEDRCTVVVDASGVGLPIVEMLRRDLLNCRLEPVTITSGRKTRHDHDGWLTPRRELIQTLALHLEQNRIRIPANIPHLDHLKQELRNISVVTCQPAHSQVHDDLAIATALAVWKAFQSCPTANPYILARCI
ncbi:MAG TPA: terminase family protein [Bryobacteraceae bacterium]|nr:terminase family protein [Bryobacteraceae bacterium]